MEIFRLHLGLMIKINIVILGNIMLVPNTYSHNIKDPSASSSKQLHLFDPPLIRPYPPHLMAKEVRSISISLYLFE